MISIKNTLNLLCHLSLGFHNSHQQVLHTDVWIDLERLSRLVESLDGNNPPFQTHLRAGYADSVLRGIGDRYMNFRFL